jgi:hypothetical protein
LDGAQIADLAQVGLSAQQASALNIRVEQLRRDRDSFAQFFQGSEEVMSVIWAPDLYSELLKCVENQISVTITVKVKKIFSQSFFKTCF